MAVVRAALGVRRLIEESAALSLLRQQNAPVTIAVLGEHLAGEQRELPAAELFESVEASLTELRDTGEFDLPQAAAHYVRSWLTAGFLNRRTGTAREELYSLTDGALAAIRFAEELTAPRTTITESRLTTIVERVHRLTVDTDPDTTRRIASLEAEKERIDEQIRHLEAGGDQTLPAATAAERAADVLSLATELPEDFARMRTDLEEINRTLRTQLIEDLESRGTVLDDIFAGVDLLAQSEAGRSFSAFYALVLDAERTAAFEDDIDQLLTRPFAAQLTAEQRHSLRRLLPAMQEASGEIHQVMTSLSRSLRRFVQSEELAEDRRVNELIRAAVTEAGTLFAEGVQPFRQMSALLGLTSVPVTNLSAMTLHSPADSAAAEPVETVETAAADGADLLHHVREAEIDRAELVSNVNTVLAEHGPSTIGEILTHQPATQGAASVVGLLVLAEEQGSPTTSGRTEIVSWAPAEDSAVPQRTATIPLFLFERTVHD
ncbi:DUF3375 domain-containing protein [Sediminivirga luteola]|uniref:DUF3375 domain-containing protein n=1 Tax=Sediminivirga luteola TaxID=1774748 RepID=UPI001F56D092|nr:DUF3375 domain-containing protein [Sediminivirga luteola]MCI2266161.1 DUF3375 domain-containing protein [Sediminivirga luteola]